MPLDFEALGADVRAVLTACGLELIPDLSPPAWRAAGHRYRGWQAAGDTLSEELSGVSGAPVRYVARWTPAPLDQGPDQEPLPVDTGEVILDVEVPLAELASFLVEARARLLERAHEVGGPFFLLEPGMLATFTEEVSGEVLGHATMAVVAAAESEQGLRVTIEQADARGDRYRFDMLLDDQALAVELRGAHDLVVLDQVWRYPLVEREWTEEAATGPVSFQFYFDPTPVVLPAGTFVGCARLTSLGPQGQAMHVYHPRSGLILSEVEDATGITGRRALRRLTRV